MSEQKEIIVSPKKAFYDRYYKLLLIIPLALLLASVIYLSMFYSQNHDFMKKDISLTGGTSLTIYSENVSITALEDFLKPKFEDFTVRELTDFQTGKQIAVVIEAQAPSDSLKQAAESFLSYSLNEKNSSIEFTGDSLSKSFYNELIKAMFFAFIFMSVVIFWIFGPSLKLKLIVSAIAAALSISLISLSSYLLPLQILLALALIYVYLKYSISSFYVITCAFSDILIPLAIINIVGVRISTAGIAAFLMLIGYSVDTDILLTTRVLKRKEEGNLNSRIGGAVKTGLTMTMTSFIAVLVAYFMVIAPTLKQVFLILSIGLFIDMVITWLMNASLLKWSCERGGIN